MGNYLLMAGCPFFEIIEPIKTVATKSIDRYCSSATAFIKELNGIFGGILFDTVCRKVIIFVDRYGMQPLFIAHHSGAAIISTSAMSIAWLIKSPFDIVGVSEFIEIRTLLGDRTLFSGVSRLSPALIMIITESGERTERYWNPCSVADSKPLTPSCLKEGKWIFNEAVKKRIPKDGVIGLQLSGGLDTRATLSALLELKPLKEIAAYTYFGPKRHVEKNVLTEIIRSTGIQHKFFYNDKDIKGEFLENLIRFTCEFDGELPGLNFYHLIPAFEMHKGLNSILFTGTGGEIFKGEHFRTGYRKKKILKDPVGHLVNKSIYGRSYLHSLIAEAELDPFDMVRESIIQEWKNCDSINCWSSLIIYYMRNNLRRLGGAGIWALNRNLTACTPFLDNDFVEFGLKFCNYENNQAKLHSFIISDNNNILSDISQYYFGGSYWITNRANSFKIPLLYWNMIRNLPAYIARHYFSVVEDNFGYRYMLQNNFDGFKNYFDSILLKSRHLYRDHKLIYILEKEISNGFLHYDALGYILSLEIISRSLYRG